ncbi:hypothetical protein KC711_05215, partial [Candidatus Peregrinibacteria bacterium]|nr:hypothetical protein [Candidatus Peregrinibacteria bacterium]
MTKNGRFLNCWTVKVMPCGLNDGDLNALNSLRLTPQYYSQSYTYKTIDSSNIKYAYTNSATRTAEDWCNTTELYLENKN